MDSRTLLRSACFARSLAKEWSLSFADIEFVNAKPVGSRLGLAVQLKFFAAFGYFATAAAEVPGVAVSYLADQLGVGETDLRFFRALGTSPLRGNTASPGLSAHLGRVGPQLDFRALEAGVSSQSETLRTTRSPAACA